MRSGLGIVPFKSSDNAVDPGAIFMICVSAKVTL